MTVWDEIKAAWGRVGPWWRGAMFGSAYMLAIITAFSVNLLCGVVAGCFIWLATWIGFVALEWWAAEPPELEAIKVAEMKFQGWSLMQHIRLYAMGKALNGSKEFKEFLHDDLSSELLLTLDKRGDKFDIKYEVV